MEDARASAESILRLYRLIGAPYFQQFSKFPDDFLRVTPPMLASGVALPFPGKSTEVRQALALARIALHAQHLEEARQFAEFGLARVGPAVALKPAFRKILSEAESV